MERKASPAEISSRFADIDRFYSIAYDLGATLFGNARGEKRIERRACVVGLSPEDARAFRQLCQIKLGPVLIELDNWLEARKTEDGIRAGVVVFQFDEVGK